jgi:hypothetical protein
VVPCDAHRSRVAPPDAQAPFPVDSRLPFSARRSGSRQLRYRFAPYPRRRLRRSLDPFADDARSKAKKAVDHRRAQWHCSRRRRSASLPDRRLAARNGRDTATRGRSYYFRACLVPFLFRRRAQYQAPPRHLTPPRRSGLTRKDERFCSWRVCAAPRLQRRGRRFEPVTAHNANVQVSGCFQSLLAYEQTFTAERNPTKIQHPNEVCIWKSVAESAKSNKSNILGPRDHSLGTVDVS